MPKLNFDQIAYNRGIVSPLALARVDVERTKLSAETQTNWTPKTQGAMRLRPGGKYLGSSASDAAAAWIEFIAATSDTALLELTNGVMRVWVSDALITRPSVGTAISNGSFATNANWTDGSTHGGAPSYGASGLTLNATNIGGICKVTRQITVAGGDQNKEHGLALSVTRGPITFRVGSTSGGDEYIAEMTLRTGYHSLAFTPTGDFYLTFQTKEIVNRIIASIAVEAAGVMTVIAPWLTANLNDIRFEQSADVVFVASLNIKQMRIERRGTGRSWSVVEYRPSAGPFIIGASSDAMIAPAATYGNTTLTASQNFFHAGHVGALFRVFHQGQSGIYNLGAADTYSDVWEVTGIKTGGGSSGVDAERTSTIVTTGTWTATVRLQRSVDGKDVGFHDVTTITTNTTTTQNDVDDNLKVWYRLAILTADYTSGTVIATVTYKGGGKDGVCKVTAYTSATQVSVEVLSRFSDTINSADWAEEQWSDVQGFPSSVMLGDGRLCWFGGANFYASVSDDYENFDANTIGDSGPIIRTIGRGPVDRINFALPLLRLVVGSDGSEIVVESTSFGEPITPTNINTRPVSTQGSANLRGLVLDSGGIFVQRSLQRVFMMTYQPYTQTYATAQLTLLVPDLLASGVVSLAVQRQPDTRVHFALGDGSVAILTYEEAEQVQCWTLYKSTAASGLVKKVMVLPGTTEDAVYYHVQRTINGVTKRYLERQAQEAESIGAANNWMMDCAVQVTQASSASVSGLSHLEGEKVIAWDSTNAVDLTPDVAQVQTTYTVSGGAITLGSAVTSVIVGLPYLDKATNEYSAQYKSTKLAYGAAAGTALTMPKRVDHLGLILGTTHNNGLYSGKDFSSLYPLPRVINGRTITNVDELFTTTTDIVPEPFTGDFDTDTRICLAAKAPRPCTVMAGVIGMATQDLI